MNRILKYVLIATGSILLLVIVAAVYWIYAPPPRSSPGPAGIQAAQIEIGGRTRSYLAYIPRHMVARPALLLAFHGLNDSAAGMRIRTAYRFEHLAESEGFIVVYPDGYQRSWNDCKKAASYPARALHIDDIGFSEALIGRFQTDHGVDPKRVFAMGLSNGGHFSFRLALERPDLVGAIAAVAANLPTPENNDCQAAGVAVPAMFINGTEDPLSPYQGGVASIFGFWPRGTVLSSKASAEYFASLGAGRPMGVPEKLPRKDTRTWVERSVWRGANNHEVILYTVHGGGHVFPQSSYRYPRLFGPTNQDLEGPDEIWKFFKSHPRP